MKQLLKNLMKRLMSEHKHHDKSYRSYHSSNDGHSQRHAVLIKLIQMANADCLFSLFTVYSSNYNYCPKETKNLDLCGQGSAFFLWAFGTLGIRITTSMLINYTAFTIPHLWLFSNE